MTSGLHGWIPYEDRTSEQQSFTKAYDEQIGTFAVRGSRAANIPDRVIFVELEKRELGHLLPRVYQQTGSCVGAAAATMYVKAQLGDVLHRSDRETIKMVFPFATYGVGRRKAGMNGPGEGSFGEAQAWACDPKNFGYVAFDDERFPQPTIKGDWWQWTAREERQWSHPRAWPVDEQQLTTTAKKYGIHAIARVRSIDELVDGLAQLYTVTIASMFAARPQVRSGVSIGHRSGSWAHQMGVSGYWKHPQLGLIFLIDNQWSARAHPQCPTLAEWGSNGSFWTYESDMEWILRTGEVFLHSSTGGFEARDLFGPQVTDYS